MVHVMATQFLLLELVLRFRAPAINEDLHSVPTFVMVTYSTGETLEFRITGPNNVIGKKYVPNFTGKAKRNQRVQQVTDA